MIDNVFVLSTSSKFMDLVREAVCLLSKGTVSRRGLLHRILHRSIPVVPNLTQTEVISISSLEHVVLSDRDLLIVESSTTDLDLVVVPPENFVVVVIKDSSDFIPQALQENRNVAVLGEGEVCGDPSLLLQQFVLVRDLVSLGFV